MSKFKLILRDGRQMAWREYGKTSGGYAVVFAHGNLNSSLLQPSWDKTNDQTESAGARVLALDRPGYGDSTAHTDRTYLDFAADVNELVTHLSISKFAVVGFSSGGPHALSCVAAALPGLISCHLISSDAPYYKLGLNKQMYGKEDVTLEYSLKNAEKNCTAMIESYQSMSKPDRIEIAMADIQHAIKNGLHGAASDSVLEAAPSWGFDLSGLNKIGPILSIWHGTDDHDVPIEAGNYLIENLLGDGNINSDNRTHIIEGENHTLIRRHWQSILTEAVTLGNKYGEGKL
jgi:pimeloyl-ACP methyl ester carboxylesterase